MYANARGVAMFIASLRTIAWDIYLRFESSIGRRGKNLFYGDNVTGVAFRSMLARTFNLDAVHGRSPALALSSSSTCCGSAC
jgi:hypothetical protein